MLVRRIFFLSVFVLVVAAAGIASAVTYSMTGSWYLNRTGFIDIPIAGGPAVCILGGTVGGIPGRFDPADPGCLGLLTGSIGNALGARPVLGGIPGSAASISVMGAAPQSFTVPPNVFFRAVPVGGSAVAVAARTTVVQLGTSFSAMGPLTSRANSPPANTRNFRQNAHVAQTGRLAASFSWCPGKLLSCATQASGTNPTYLGRIVYTAGPNRFGGTMSILGAGSGEVHRITGNPHAPGPLNNPTQTMYNGSKSVLAQPLAGVGSQAQGRGYSSIDTDMLAGGQINYSYQVTFPCTVALPPAPIGCGQIAALGPVNGTGSASVNRNWGFPWTTGTVTGRNVETINQQPGTTTLTAMGADFRTAAGRGNIVMVAGGMTNRKSVAVSTNFMSLDVVRLHFLTPVPSLSTPALAAVGALIVLAAGYALRRRI